MKDISSRADIELLLQTFYKEALKDPSIGMYFTEVVEINLEEHIPEITDFWEQQLFQSKVYKKNVIAIHKNINVLKALNKTHFDTWLYLFTKTVDQTFSGEKAELIKTRALSIATIMQLKMN